MVARFGDRIEKVTMGLCTGVIIAMNQAVEWPTKGFESGSRRSASSKLLACFRIYKLSIHQGILPFIFDHILSSWRAKAFFFTSQSTTLSDLFGSSYVRSLMNSEIWGVLKTIGSSY